MTNCQHCHKPMKPATANLLCASCRTDYWTMIRQLGHVQLPALSSIMLKQAHIGSTGHTPSRGNAPMPIDTHAQDLIADSEAWLAEQAGKIRAAYAAYDWRKAWYAIISNRHTTLNMPTAADDYTSLEHISRRNETALTPESELIILGTCPTCRHQLTGTPDAESVTCQHCRTEWAAPAIKAARDERLWQVQITGTPSDAAKELKRYGLTISRNLVSQWLRRGKLHATPTNTKNQYVFNLGELAALLDCHR
ncbi:PhnA protein [Bifidobacterium adolescentis]|nr:PhnA protein [Bifidobacterium adolescentis]KAB5923760.1 PhnA protein [Bifidobacterium adolescentis]